MKIVVLDKTNDTADLLRVNFLGESLVDEIEQAHEDYNKRKNEVISKLYTIWRNDEIPAVYRNWIRQAARFINESDMK
ncbi:MAG: hypothetical protein IKY26_04025 [Erysipelotrichaceae bacterium]|nr:hypothetical protein [Erysipelotrichaceae bacterium]